MLELGDQEGMVGGFFEAAGFDVDPDFLEPLLHRRRPHDEIDPSAEVLVQINVASEWTQFYRQFLEISRVILD